MQDKCGTMTVRKGTDLNKVYINVQTQSVLGRKKNLL